MGKELCGSSRIFRRDQIDFAERPQGAKCQVLEISDGRCDDKEGSEHDSYNDGTVPLYEFECESCHHRFERIQKFSDPLPEKCPHCGRGPIKKRLSTPAIQFKGSGFYITDYAKKSDADGREADKKGEAASSDTKTAAASSDSKDSKDSKDTSKSSTTSDSSTTTSKESSGTKKS